MKKLLITHSLFMFTEHEIQLEEAGFEIERLDLPEATEEQLIEALKDKDAYILGGLEKVTEKVIESTDQLKAIVFTGSDWRHFIPGYELATKKGIAIANAPGANKYAVAEYVITLILGMTRNIFELGRTGEKTFQTTPSLSELTIGIIGMGKIGQQVTKMLKGLGVKEVLYWSRNRKESFEKETGAIYTELDDVFKKSDIVSQHLSKEAGVNFITKEHLAKLKDKSLVINCGSVEAMDTEALYEELSSGRLRAAQDRPLGDRFNKLPLSTWFSSNSSTAYNTHEANKKASDMVVTSIINLLDDGEDVFKVN